MFVYGEFFVFKWPRFYSKNERDQSVYLIASMSQSHAKLFVSVNVHQCMMSFFFASVKNSDDFATKMIVHSCIAADQCMRPQSIWYLYQCIYRHPQYCVDCIREHNNILIVIRRFFFLFWPLNFKHLVGFYIDLIVNFVIRLEFRWFFCYNNLYFKSKICIVRSKLT